MDATAYGGGPGTFVAQIATGSPESIDKLVAQRLKQAEQFLALINQARTAVQTLEKAWSGQASDTAVKKFTDTLDSFEKIVKVIQATSDLLATSSTLVKAAQTAYTSVVSSVNPVVASLASNWWTYWAAVSLSSSASAGLRAFINGIEAMLSALGGGQLAQEITGLIQIIGDVEKLISSGSHGGTVPPAGAFAQPGTGTPANQLITPPQIASATGQQVANSGGQDPAVAATLGQYGGQPTVPVAGNPVTGTTAGVPYTPSQYPTVPGASQQPVGLGNQNSGWIPVDPVPQTQAQAPAPGVVNPVIAQPLPQTPPGDVTVTTTYDGVSTTVTMPVGTQTDVTLVDPKNGSSVTEHIMAGVSGNA